MPEHDHERDVDSGLPWAFVLDPAANARALGEVQRRGLNAARELVERVASAVDRPENARQPFGWPAGGAGSNGAGGQTPPELVNRLMQGWWELTMNTMTAFLPNWTGGPPNHDRRPGPGSPGRNGSREDPAGPHDPAPTVDVTPESGPVIWHLEVDSDGSLHRGGQLWLRNPSPKPLGFLRLSVSDLRADSGATIASSQVCLDPSSVKKFPARSARGVEVELRLDGRVASGTYRGVVRGDGAVDLHIPIEIEVGARRSTSEAPTDTDRMGT